MAKRIFPEEVAYAFQGTGLQPVFTWMGDGEETADALLALIAHRYGKSPLTQFLAVNGWMGDAAKVLGLPMAYAFGFTKGWSGNEEDVFVRLRDATLYQIGYEDGAAARAVMFAT